jgi:hypothetical protein
MEACFKRACSGDKCDEVYWFVVACLEALDAFLDVNCPANLHARCPSDAEQINSA